MTGKIRIAHLVHRFDCGGLQNGMVNIISRLLGGSLPGTGIFEMGTVESLVSQHQSGLREHSAVLWSLLIYESFKREVLAA